MYVCARVCACVRTGGGGLRGDVWAGWGIPGRIIWGCTGIWGRII